MGRADLLISGLRSRRLRSRVLGPNLGSRIIGQPQEEEGFNIVRFTGNVLNGLFQGATKVGGWIFKGVVGIGLSARAIVDVMINTFDYLYEFNWNVTDVELDRSIANLQLRLVGQLGATFGNLVGYLACGVIPSIGVMVFNEPLGLYLLKEVGEEALDELLDNVRLLLRQSLYGLLQASWITMFKSTRRVVKGVFKDPDSPQSRFAKRVFGNNFDHIIKTWGEEGSKPWSFAINAEARRDAIKDPFAQEFWEEYDDEFGDACRDALYVIGDGIDTWVLQQQLDQAQQEGLQHTVELTPNRQAEEERLILSGTETEIQTQMMAAMATHNLIDNRDVGMWVGEPLRWDMRNKPPRFAIRIQFFNNPTPPFYSGGETVREVTCTIPGIKRSKLDWETIKEACGGNNGYTWGRFLATANLENDQGEFAGKMMIYGGSENEAEKQLKRLLELSDYTIQTLSITEERREGKRANNRQLYKESTQVYPAYLTIINTEKVFREDQGDVTLQGTYKRRRDKILLWTPSKPPGFEEQIQELVRVTPQSL